MSACCGPGDESEVLRKAGDFRSGRAYVVPTPANPSQKRKEARQVAVPDCLGNIQIE